MNCHNLYAYKLMSWPKKLKLIMFSNLSCIFGLTQMFPNLYWSKDGQFCNESRFNLNWEMKYFITSLY